MRKGDAKVGEKGGRGGIQKRGKKRGQNEIRAGEMRKGNEGGDIEEEEREG